MRHQHQRGARLAVQLEKQRDHWRAAFDVPGVAAAYDVAVREPLQADFPVLGRIETSGKASGVIEQQRLPNGERHVGGFVDLHGVSFTVSDPSIAIAGLDAHVPLDLGAAGADNGAQEGLLRMRGLNVATVAVGKWHVGLTFFESGR